MTRQHGHDKAGHAQDGGSILVVTGRGLPVRGDDIDTDRIMPARFLRATSFEGLERHVFEDDFECLVGGDH